MGRGAVKASQEQLGLQRDAANQFGGRASGVYNQLFPELESQYANPQGFGVEGRTAMNTAARDTAGGALASEKGEAGTMAARTRNIGSQAPLLDSAVQGADKQGQEAMLKVQEADAALKADQQAKALSGMQGLYGTNTGAMLTALGQGNNSIGNWNQASAQTTATWLPIVQQLMSNAMSGGVPGMG